MEIHMIHRYACKMKDPVGNYSTATVDIDWDTTYKYNISLPYRYNLYSVN